MQPTVVPSNLTCSVSLEYQPAQAALGPAGDRSSWTELPTSCAFLAHKALLKWRLPHTDEQNKA